MTDQPPDWDRVFRVEAKRLTRFLRRFGPAVSPEDITQESFVRVCRVDPATVTSPRGLLYQTARNLAVNQIRRARIAPERSVGDVTALADAIDTTLSPEDAMLSFERVRAILAAIDALPEAQRVALLACRVERFSAPVIAESLGVSPRHVHRLIAQAEQRLRASMAELDGGSKF